MMTWGDALFLLPELVLALGASLLLIAPVVGRGETRRSGDSAKWAMLALLAITAGAVFLSSWGVQSVHQSRGFRAMFALDGFSLFFKLLFLVILALVTLLSDGYLRGTRYSAWEYYSLLAFALCGMFFMASGIHLATIYVGLELMSLSSYILAGYFKNEQKSTEAAMKYFVLGAVSSAILLYGISLIYGVTGTLSLVGVSNAMATLVTNDALMFGIMMLGAGLCFKIAAAPFHVWTPDVYEGAPTPVTAFLSTASKAAAFAIFARIFYVGVHHFRLDWQYVLAIVAALSMILGNLAAITQDNVKRMLAYSSIGHAGYVLLGIISVSEMGLRGILVYSVVYVFATLGIWATVLMLQQQEYAGELVDDFEGLHRRAPFWAFAMVVFLLSLGGIPPTAGFIGKYFLFYAAVGAGFGWLAIIAVLMSAVSMFFYFRLVMAMYLREGREDALPAQGTLRFVAAICLVVTLLFGILPSPLIDQARISGRGVAARAALVTPNGR
ncbi:MAG: NADH-quinone oxidoreductase subunit N [Acidobacteria bacterium]|nr:NADH-quinone oxidoreductase subunit N [Acidobacteriota bacterium]MBV9476411.1 NADH-quinone oxidoreductase subunit N [Acidobacteriota bacterium]